MDRPKEALFYTIGMAVQQVLTFGSSVVIARMLGPGDFGILSITRNVFQFSAILAPLGLDLALMKTFDVSEAARGRSFGLLRRLRLLVLAANLLFFAVVLLGVAPLLEAHVYKVQYFTIYLAIAMSALPFTADSAVLSAVFRAIRRPLLYTFSSLYIQPIVRFILLVAMLLLGARMFGALAATALAAMVNCACLGYNLRCWKTENTVVEELSDRGEVGAILKASVWMALTVLVYNILRMLDILMLGAFVTPAEVGSYAAASSIALIIQFLPQGISQTLGPKVADLFRRGESGEIQSLYAHYFRVGALLASPVFGGIAVFGQDLDLILGSKFHFDPIVSLSLSASFYVSAIYAPTGFMLSMTGRHKAELAVLAAGAAFVMLLLAVFVPRYGLLGASSSVIAGYVFVNAARYTLVKRWLKISLGGGKYLLIPAAVLGCAYVARFVGVHVANTHLWQAALGVLVYLLVCGVLYRAAILNKNEMAYLCAKLLRKNRASPS